MGSARNPTTLSKPIRPRRILASSSLPGGVSTTIRCSGRSTVPAYSANRPSRPMLIDPAQMRRREVLGRAGIEYHRTFELIGRQLGKSDRDRWCSFVEQ